MTVNYKDDLIVITGASGKQSSHLLPHLAAKFSRLRLVVHSPSSASRMASIYPNAEVLIADMASPSDVRKILSGAASLFQIGPTFHPQELTIGYNMIAAAQKEAQDGKFQHFVLSSVLNTQISKMLNHDVKRYIEERLLESGLNFTILQPAIFMDAFPIPQLMGMEKPVYKANWSTDVPFSFVALRDLGEVAAKVLGEREKHYLAQYQCVGVRPMTYKTAAEIVGKEMGKEIIVEERTYGEAVQFYLEMLFGEEGKKGTVHAHTVDTTERMLLYYNRHSLAGNPNVLEWLLGRKPTGYAELARARVQQVRAQEGKTNL